MELEKDINFNIVYIRRYEKLASLTNYCLDKSKNNTNYYDIEKAKKCITSFNKAYGNTS